MSFCRKNSFCCVEKDNDFILTQDGVKLTRNIVELMQSSLRSRPPFVSELIGEVSCKTADSVLDEIKKVNELSPNKTVEPVCRQLQESMLNCYRQNKRLVLNCSKEVKLFRQCVENSKKAVFGFPR